MLAARAYFAAKERPLYDSIMEPPSWAPSQAELEDDEVEQVHDTVRIFRGAGNPHATARTVVSMALTQFFIRARELLKDAVWVPLRRRGEIYSPRLERSPVRKALHGTAREPGACAA